MINYYDTAAAALKDIEAQTTPEAKANKLNAIVQEWATHWRIFVGFRNEPKARKCLCNTLELLEACKAERIFMHRSDINALLEFEGDFIQSLTDCLYFGGEWDWNCLDGEKLDAEKNERQKRVLLRMYFNYIEGQQEPQPDLEPLKLGDKEPLARAVFDMLTKEKPEWMAFKNGKYKWVLTFTRKGQEYPNYALLAYICNCIWYDIERAPQRGFNNACMFDTYFLGKEENKLNKALQQKQVDQKSFNGEKYNEAREIIVKAQAALSE